MRNPSLICPIFLAFSTIAQPTLPPDIYGERLDRTGGITENLGQVADEHGDPITEITHYGEGGFPQLYIRKDTRLTFVLADPYQNANMPHVVRRLDMTLIGEVAEQVDAVSVQVKGFHQNFYLPHCGPAGVTDVRSYNAVVYASVYPNIDLVLYSTPS